MSALTITAILVAWCLLSLPVGILIGRSFKASREFDDSLTAVAEAVGVLPGVEVELSADYRHDYLKGWSA